MKQLFDHLYHVESCASASAVKKGQNAGNHIKRTKTCQIVVNLNVCLLNTKRVSETSTYCGHGVEETGSAGLE